jgi:SNF2 family DNA or RNA helicase
VTVPRKSLEPYLYDTVDFYPHQVDGIRVLARLPNFLLADQMGLGKSLQALTVFTIDVKLGKASKMLVVCPVSLRGNWADEIEKFTRFPVLRLGEESHPSRPGSYRTLNAADRTIQLKEFAAFPLPRIVICNYEQVDAHLSDLNAFGFDFLVCDEAHMIKNPDSKRTKATLKLKRERTGLLTGTPVLNQVGELWPLLHMINPSRWPSPRAFLNRYAVYGGYKSKQIIGQKNVKELNDVLSQIMLRRYKKDVLTIPEAKKIQVNVDLHPVQRKLYDDLYDELFLPDINGDPQEVKNSLVKFLRLKQICGSSATVAGHPDHSHKLDVVVDKCLEVLSNDEKVVVFTQFRDIHALIVNRLRRAGVSPVAELHGDVLKADRQPVVKNWGSYKGPAPIVCMIQVAGIGLNMTSARTAVFADKLFTPGLNDQALDRLHRIGQQEVQAVEAYEIIARGTIEQRIERILKGKVINNNELVEESVSFQRLMQIIQQGGGV